MATDPNFVFEAEYDGTAYIVRMSSDRAKMSDYIKEQWVVARVREAGVPTHEILEVGNAVVPYPYMIAIKAHGQEAVHHPQRFAVLSQMGRYAARIHTIRTSGFGKTFDWSGNQLSRHETWKEFLHVELGVNRRIELLQQRRMLSSQQVKSLRRTLEATEHWQEPPSLNHGDLRLKNVLVDESGAITAIIDWENCISAVAPYWDFAIALHDLSIDAKEQFLAGYGQFPGSIRAMAPILKALNILHYAPEIKKLDESRDTERLEQYRTRLCGALDLYSLEWPPTA